jgi:hypothetical protein
MMMENLIDELKSRDATRDPKIQQADQIRLRNVEVRRAKLPFFWDALVKQIKSTCDKLRTEFPDRADRHCDIVMRGQEALALRINSHGALPRYNLRIECDNVGLTLRYIEIIERALYQDEVEGMRGEIQVKVRSADEALVFVYDGRDYDSPGTLAEAFIRRVIQE